MDHRYWADQCVDGLEKYYYKPLEKKRGKCIRQLLEGNNFQDPFVFKPEYFNYILFYQIYSISHHWTHHHYMPLLFHLHSFYMTYQIQNEMEKRYAYESPFDTTFIKEIAFYLYQSLLFYKVKNTPKDSLSAFTYVSLLSLFILLMNYHETHQERLKAIQEKRSSEHSLRKILITTPNKIMMQKVIHYTRHFTFSNFLFFLSSLLWFIL
jgi:hypothetical protein